MDLMTSNPKLDDELFDDSSGYEEDKGIQLNSGLTDMERRQATMIYRLFNELWGLCIVRGDPGTGKDTFLNWLAYRVKRYFPQKKILRDEKPRRLFGTYAGLFNEQALRDDLKRMRDFAKGLRKDAQENKMEVYSDALEKAADEWVGSDGAKVLLQNSLLCLTEFWKYVYNRTPHDPMNKTMGGIHKMKRHLNTLIVGCTQLESDLDKRTCKPFVDWRVTCTRSRIDTTRYNFIIEKVKYDKNKDLILPVARPFAIPVDAGKPRSFMGDGKIIIRKPDYHPETQEERIILDVVRAGVDRYEDIVALLGKEGDMNEKEILLTLKQLTLKLPNQRPKFVLWYPCDYFTFNSRSTPQLRTNVRVGD